MLSGIRGRERTTERLGERLHVGQVLGVRLVPEVGCDLVGERAARHGSTVDVPARRGAVVPPSLPIQLYLIASAVGRELDGMQVDASPVRMHERDRGW